MVFGRAQIETHTGDPQTVLEVKPGYKISHRGDWCTYVPDKFCQQGFCDTCTVYEDCQGSCQGKVDNSSRFSNSWG